METQVPFASARRLIDRIAAAWAESSAEGPTEVVRRLREQKLDEAQFVVPVPKSLPVLRYLPECLDGARKFNAGIADDLARVSGGLRWLQSVAYTDAILGEGFVENYGWAELIGPKGFFRGDDFLLGVLMLGPHRHYRDHFHPAPELYWPLTGGTQWRQGTHALTEKPAGSVIWHPSHEIHATRTLERPLLTLWAWTRETTTPAQLVELKGHPVS